MAEEELDLNAQLLVRQEKLQALRDKGNPYPNDFKRLDYAAKVLEEHAAAAQEQLAALEKRVVVAGRIMMRRIMGKASFVQLQDMSGQIQIYLKLSELPDGVYAAFKDWDLGDIIGVHGTVFRTKTGELSIKASNIQLLTKALRPLPDKWHGLTDKETKYRQRYLDLIVNEDTRKTFRTRSEIIKFIRNFLEKKGFMEVETPMMHVIPGGATARPFITHHNSLDMDLYLRVAPELYLKRLVVGGMEQVFEINRNFRNEGLSTRHNPEFTMVEFYKAYADYTDMMDLTEAMLKEMAQSVKGSTKISYQDQEIDFAASFVRMTIAESVVQYNDNIDANNINDKEILLAYSKKLGVAADGSWGLGKLQFALFEKTVEEKLIQPTFITEYPVEVSPLARKNNANPEITDRFELFIAGREIANAFSELNDAADQAARFKAQAEQLASGDNEAMHYDADYINALEHGMPPTAGEGIGIDRLVMLFTDSAAIRDVILFPQMRKS
ncbi:MAG: lysine--tRNA ligase [Legionellales bacterium]|nr:MAG: lysine--tRNA ligase [Legionellales bacterium]